MAVGGRDAVRIVVAGDPGTGKSSLIVTAVSQAFPINVAPVLPPSRLPDDIFPDCVPVTIIDTSSSIENRNRLAEELRRADAVVLTYACDQPETVDRLGKFWLPELRRLEVTVPVIVVGCKLDLTDDLQHANMEQIMMPIMQQFREIETCIECSSYSNTHVLEVFFYAQKAILYPTRPLFDRETQTIQPRCLRALKRIFILCDHDLDGALSDAELNDFQVTCFDAPLQTTELFNVTRVVQERVPNGVNELGLTLSGFLYLHALFIERGRIETIWIVMRKFGYDDDLRLTKDLLPPTFRRAPDQGVELTKSAIEFLKGVFTSYDTDRDGVLRPSDLHDELFSTAIDSPWIQAPYNDVAATTALGDFSVEGFLSMWTLMTLLDPAKSVEYLRYLMYDGDAASAIRVTRKRSIDIKKQQTDRKVFQCFVFGPEGAGKSAMLSAFLGRPFSENYTSKVEERYAVGFVDEPTGAEKVLVMREIPEAAIPQLLSGKESLAPCDVAIFVYDSSDEMSWKKMSRLLVDIAGHGEDTGYKMPCLIVAAKDDLEVYSSAIPDSTRASQDMGIDAPIPISTKLGDFSNVFRRIIRAAEHPHLSIPETESGRRTKHYHRLINRSLVVISVGAAAAVVGLSAYRVYAARKNG